MTEKKNNRKFNLFFWKPFDVYVVSRLDVCWNRSTFMFCFLRAHYVPHNVKSVLSDNIMPKRIQCMLQKHVIEND